MALREVQVHGEPRTRENVASLLADGLHARGDEGEGVGLANRETVEWLPLVKLDDVTDHEAHEPCFFARHQELAFLKLHATCGRSSMVEHRLAKAKAAGSSPAGRSVLWETEEMEGQVEFDPCGIGGHWLVASVGSRENEIRGCGSGGRKWPWEKEELVKAGW